MLHPRAAPRPPEIVTPPKPIALLTAVLAAALTLQAQSNTPRQILPAGQADDRASVTPDGRTMALTDWNSGDVAFLDLASHKLRRLMAKPQAWESDDFASMPVPSLDGKQVAFLYYEGGANPDLRISAVPKDGQPDSKPRVLVHNPEFAYVLPAAWSADSSALLVTIWKRDNTAQIAWVSTAGGSNPTIRVLRSLDWRRPGRLSLSPDRRWIAYSALAAPNSTDSHIYILSADGSTETELIQDPGVNEAPIFTPDGEHLLFTSDRSGDFDLWSLPLHHAQPGGAPTRVLAKIGRITPLGLTSTGSLYFTRENNTENVVIANFKGTSLTGQPFLLTDTAAGLNRGPAWSPDGRSLAFKRRSLSNRTGYDLIVRNLVTGQEKTYPNNTLTGSPSRPAWFADGKSLLTAFTDVMDRVSLLRLNLATGEFAEAAASDTRYLAMFALAPDQRTVYIATRDDQHHTGGVVSIDMHAARGGSDPQPVLSTPGFVNAVALSPGGRTLAIARSLPNKSGWEAHLTQVPTQGGQLRDIYVQPQDAFGGGPPLAWLNDTELLFGAGEHEWRILWSKPGAEPIFTGLTTTGLRHDLTIDPNSDPQAPRIAFSDGRSSIKEAFVLDNAWTGPPTAEYAPARLTLAILPTQGLDVLTLTSAPPTQIAQGKRLFFDTRLSADNTLSCASCHQPERAFSDGRPVAQGVNNAQGTRNSAALINRAYGQTFFWDGRADTLAHQAKEPILNPKELALSEPELERKLGMKTVDITAALAAYVSSIRSADSRYDRYEQGDSRALTDLEKAGLEIFRGKGRCIDCHVGPNFTDEQFHNTGVAWRDNHLADEGRASVTHNAHDRGAFKTPTLREVALTAPYMHDGSFATLEDVIDYYSEGARPNPNLDPDIRPRRFTPEEKRALAAFLRALSGKIQY